MSGGTDNSSMIKTIVSGVSVIVISAVILYFIGINGDGSRSGRDEPGTPTTGRAKANDGAILHGDNHTQVDRRPAPASDRRDVVSEAILAGPTARSKTTETFDGPRLAEEAAAQEEAEGGSTALLKGALNALPTLLTASVSGRPEYDRARSEAILRIVVKPDLESFSAYREQLEAKLKKIAVSTETTLVRGDPVDAAPDLRWNPNVEILAGPSLDGMPEGCWCIWINASNDELHTRTRWNYYVVTADLAESLSPLLGETQIALELLDSDGRTVAEDELPLPIDEDLAFRFGYSPGGQDNPLPVLRRVVIRGIKETEVMEGINAGRLNRFLEQKMDQRQAYLSAFTANLYIAPYSFTVKSTGYGTSFYYSPSVEIEHRLRLSQGELQRVDRVQASVSFKRNGSDREF